MKRQIGAAALGLGAMLLAVCQPTYNIDISLPIEDGMWKGQSNPDDQGAISVITIVVENGDITNTICGAKQADSSDKGGGYGRDSSGQVFNEEYYARV